jgi:hypothetical protein
MHAKEYTSSVTERRREPVKRSGEVHRTEPQKFVVAVRATSVSTIIERPKSAIRAYPYSSIKILHY